MRRKPLNDLAVKVKNLTKVYPGNIVGVKDLSFDLRKGEILGLVGPNGSGKTTTIKSILRLIDYSQGEIWVNGHPAGSKEARTCTAYIPEIPLLYDDLTVVENLRFMSMAYGRSEKEATQRIEQLLREFDLYDRRNETPLAFSKGMRKKVAIMYSLIHKSSVFLVDEPFTGVEPMTVRVLKRKLLKAKENGKAILFSTHILSVAEEICDRFLILHKGKKIAQGTLKELRDFVGLEDQDIHLEDIFVDIIESQAVREENPE